jgi:hypothetical protein
MVKLVKEDVGDNGIFIVTAQKILKLQDLTSTQGKRITSWNQVVRYAIQQLKMKKWVQIVDCKTFESIWLQPNNINDYTQSGGILNITGE